MNIVKSRLLIFFLLITFLNISQVKSQMIFETFSTADWVGKGTLMGAEAIFNMRWQSKLDSNFMSLEFQNQRKSENGNVITFKAIAYYKLTNDSKITGYWFDSRGISFPLSGDVNENTLTINWGSNDTEQGMTTYKLTDDKKIHVVDYIYRDNQQMQFGEAFYEKNERAWYEK